MYLEVQVFKHSNFVKKYLPAERPRRVKFLVSVFFTDAILVVTLLKNDSDSPYFLEMTYSITVSTQNMQHLLATLSSQTQAVELYLYYRDRNSNSGCSKLYFGFCIGSTRLFALM